MDLTVDADRLRDDIEATAAFGDIDADEGHGRTVLVGSEANRRAREYLLDRMDAADLDVTVDAVGNIAGTWTPDGADPDAAPVAAGSHLDSVPEGGIFDGPLGVYAALEAVRAMQDAGVSPDRPVTVVSFTEEEGQRFADGLLGSSVAVGERSVEEALALEGDRAACPPHAAEKGHGAERDCAEQNDNGEHRVRLAGDPGAAALEGGRIDRVPRATNLCHCARYCDGGV